MRRPKTLSAAFVKTVSAPGRYGDGRGGHGLSLLVKSTATGRVSKSWSQRVRLNGKPANLGLGTFPVVTLADARAKALENRRIIAQGRDPRNGGIPTFSEAAERVIAIHAEGWKDSSKSAAQWRASLRDHAFPRLGRKRVSDVTTADVMCVLLPIWNSKRETAMRVRQRIGAVMRWAVAEGFRDDNPAGEAIGAALPKNGVVRQHHKALPHEKVGDALLKVRNSNAHPLTKLAFEFLVLTACRSGEVRGARWDEVDVEAGTWIVSAERMKTGRAHRVPLSTRALAVLEESRELADRSGLVFPSPTGRALSDATLSKLLRENKVGAVPHGFRSSFRDWCGDTGQPREVAEAALAHVIRDKAEAAYARSDLLDRRRELMESWASYLG